MKTKSLIALLALTIGLSSSAQNIEEPKVDKTNGFLEFGTTFPFYKGAKPFLDLNFGFTRQIEDNFSLGLGTGLKENTLFKNAPTIPVFVRADFCNKKEKFEQFLTVDAGYILDPADIGRGEILINPVIGVRYGKISLGIGYCGFIPTYSNAKTVNCLSLRIGYNFGYHSTKGSRAILHPDLQVETGFIFPISGNYKKHFYKENGNKIVDETYKIGMTGGTLLHMALTWPVIILPDFQTDTIMAV